VGGIRRREIEGIEERIIPAEVITADILEPSIENAIAAANHKTAGGAIRKSKTRREVRGLRSSERERGRMHQRDAVLRESVDEVL
jgi:hypothetical protein